MFFVLRYSNEIGILAQNATKIKLLDLLPLSGIEVFDIALDYYIDPLNEFLFSQNLGNRTDVVHSADIDFSNVTHGIAGAISGVNCGPYEFILQVSL